MFSHKEGLFDSQIGKIEVSHQNTAIIDAYNVAYYKINIAKNSKRDTEFIYTYSLDEGIFDETTSYYVAVISRQVQKKHFLPAHNLISLSPTAKNIFSLIEKAILNIINHELVVSESMREKLKKIKTFIVFSVIGISSFYPLFIDPHIQEIYIDSEDTYPYIDHFKYGRCIVNRKFNLIEIKRLVNLAILNGNLRLSEKNPSVKTELITDYFQVRVTIDTHPITQSSYSLDIRRAKKKMITITELLAQNVLSLDALAVLYFLMKHKVNIVVIGSPGSGKTTFANALDMLTPRYWRKIYVEDVIESLDLRKYGHHQFKLKVNNVSSTKYNEIVKILHRNPDWVYLGEILTREHSQALFHAILSGIAGIQTYHASNAKTAISRWHNYHSIPYSVISHIGLIVTISKRFTKGGYLFRIIEISEVVPTQEEKSPIIFPLFARNNLTDKLVFQKHKILDVQLAQSVAKSYGLTVDEVIQDFDNILQIFEILVKDNVTTVGTIIEFINEVGKMQSLGGADL